MDFANFLSCSRTRLTTRAPSTTVAPSLTSSRGAQLKQVHKTSKERLDNAMLL